MQLFYIRRASANGSRVTVFIVERTGGPGVVVTKVAPRRFGSQPTRKTYIAHTGAELTSIVMDAGPSTYQVDYDTFSIKLSNPFSRGTLRYRDDQAFFYGELVRVLRMYRAPFALPRW